jgi:ribonuclease-3
MQSAVGFVPFENFVGRAEMHVLLDRRAAHRPGRIWEVALDGALEPHILDNQVLKTTDSGRKLPRALAARGPGSAIASAIRNLLETALTHIGSADSRGGSRSYQRLEFLGDRVLGLSRRRHAVHHLSAGRRRRHVAPPRRSRAQGDLRRSRRSDGMSARIMRLGEGEILSGARKNKAILSDVCEAIIGAVFHRRRL